MNVAFSDSFSSRLKCTEKDRKAVKSAEGHPRLPLRVHVASETEVFQVLDPAVLSYSLSMRRQALAVDAVLAPLVGGAFSLALDVLN